jgi:two-component system chemotaxis sensor kinase CheA
MSDGLRGKRILIMDDNVQNITVLRTLLQHRGATVIVGWWTKEEVSKIEAQFPLDLILLDLMLPGWRTGYDVFDQIRRMPEFQKVPIVAISAQDTSLAVPATRDKGFNGFISKPIDTDALPGLLEAVLRGETVWHTSNF